MKKSGLKIASHRVYVYVDTRTPRYRGHCFQGFWSKFGLEMGAGVKVVFLSCRFLIFAFFGVCGEVLLGWMCDEMGFNDR